MSRVTSAPPGGRSAVAMVRRALQLALARSPEDRGRLSYARTSLRLTVDGETDAVTLLLDRDPPAVVDDEPAEVEVTLTRPQAHAMSRSELLGLRRDIGVTSGDTGTCPPCRLLSRRGPG